MCVCFSHNTKRVDFQVISFVNSTRCLICISNKLKYLKNEAEGNEKLQRMFLCRFKTSFK